MTFERKIILLSCSTMFVSLLDVNIVLIAYPEIARHFQSPVSEVIKVSMFFLMALTVSTPICGKLNDMWGVKPVILTGYLLFALTGLMCGISQTLTFLSISRGIQGLGAALMSIAATTAVITYIPAQKRGIVFGLLATSGSLGLILGSPLGGMITGMFGWQGVFFTLVPLGLIMAVFSTAILPVESPPSRSFLKDFDLKGAAIISLGISTLVFSMQTYIQANRFTTASILLLIAGITATGLFVIHAKKAPSPLMDLTILKNRTFRIILLANMAATAMLSMNNFIIPFYITGHHRLSPENTGLTILAFSAVYGIFSPFVGKLTERIPPGRLCITGTIFMMVSACWFLFYLDSSSLFHVFVLLAGFGIGFALFISPANILALGMADRSNAGSLTAMFRTTRQFASRDIDPGDAFRGHEF